MTTVDVLIITALKEEFEAARTARNGVTRWQEHDGYLVGRHHGLTVALARPTRMGGRSTSPVATALTGRLTPTCLAMCGVCAGSPDDTAPGDVVAAAPAFEYDEGKHKGETFQGDVEQYPQDERWLRAIQDFVPESLPSYGEATGEEAVVWFLERLHREQDPRVHPARTRYFPRGTWHTRLEQMEADGLIRWESDGWVLTESGRSSIERRLYNDVDGPDKLPFAVLAGPMASGSAVMQDPGIWTRLKNMGSRKILALEMEAATIATVAHNRRVPHWLVVKGVMDNADLAKDDRFKAFAAGASAEVLFALLPQLLTPAARPTREPATATRTAYPGSVKLQILRRLTYNWQDVADLVGVPVHAQARFRYGDEPRGLWEWLENRGRLADLPDALDEIGRPELADLLRHPEDG